MSSVNAILPSLTSWGFNTAPSDSTSTTASKSHFQFGQSTQRTLKRKMDEMTPQQQQPVNNLHSTTSSNSRMVKRKRAKLQELPSRPLPVSRLVETLDRHQLENLMVTLCQSHPALATEVSRMAGPTVTVASAHELLKSKLEAIFLGLPYKGDQQNDYAFHRVKPLVDDFLSALGDFMAHFLPPNESQIYNSLAFLEGATTYLHRLPTWSREGNNLAKFRMFKELESAWVLVFGEIMRQSNGMLSLAYESWVQKVRHLNEITDNRLEQVINYLENSSDNGI